MTKATAHEIMMRQNPNGGTLRAVIANGARTIERTIQVKNKEDVEFHLDRWTYNGELDILDAEIIS